ncbi:DUF2794 domain-containing protein [Haematospirillum sp. H1815]|uniref:DUF2794 domain-containing protein n=1 Tax=Haematospirillum sp. H1815 TaxID=2723108 RepID=UPI001439DAC2|nr:DUF2794 domain-containing protein [Haematospirillum sp. H1815]NKD77700.1 DUF2794 domain-containing protein [Haematospirillum sp. H1815]
MTQVVPLAGYRACRHGMAVFFNRDEMSALLGVYADCVSRGGWRDYAIGSDGGQAWFAVCRYAGERPVCVLTKRAVSGHVVYTLFDESRRVRQSRNLSEVLGCFRRISAAV